MYGSHDFPTVIELSMAMNNADADVEKKKEEGRLVRWCTVHLLHYSLMNCFSSYIIYQSNQITKLQLFSFDNIRQQLQHNLMLCTIESEIEIRKAQLLFITSSTDQYKIL